MWTRQVFYFIFIKNYNENLVIGQPDEVKIIKNLRQFKNENKKYKKNRL